MKKKYLPLNNGFNFTSEYGVDLRQRGHVGALERESVFFFSFLPSHALFFSLRLHQEAEINNDTINNFYREEINL